MPDLAVSTAFKGKDFISKHFKRMGAQSKMFGNTATKSFNKASRAGTKFGTITKGILAAGAVQRGLALVQQGVGSVLTEFVMFDDAIVAAGARFKDIGPDALNFEKQLISIKEAARFAGATTEFTASQSAQALDFLARAGWKSTEAIGGLASMINLATTTGEDFARVADISSDLMGSFGLNTDNTAKKIQNLNRLNDVLAKTSNAANVTIENMFDTMTQIGPIASGVLGASLEEVASLTAVLGNSGIKGTQAMTALKNAYLRLAAPAGKGAKILRALNLTLDDGKGGAKSMTVLMSQLGKKLKTFTTIQQAQILNELFGKRAIAGGKNLIDNIANIKKFNKALIESGGVNKRIAELMRTSLGNRLAALKSAAIETGFKFLEAFKVNGVGAIERLTAAVRGFDMKPIIRGVKITADVFGGLYSAIKPLIPLIKLLVVYTIAYNLVLKAFIALEAIKTFFLFVRAIQAATVAQGLLNTVMMLNPVGAVIIGVVALIAALVLLYKNWDKVKEIMGVTFDFWGPKIKTILNIMRPFIYIPLLLLENWRKVFKVLKVSFDFWIPKFEKLGWILGQLGKQKEAEITAPNKTDVEARQKIDFTGRLDIAGASHGSTVTGKTRGAPPIRMDLLGSNHG